MDSNSQSQTIGVRADTQSFAQDVAEMQSILEDGLGRGAEQAGAILERSLVNAIRTGKLSFDDLEATALRVLDRIANAAIKAGLDSILGGGNGGESDGGGGFDIGGLVTSLLGLPGRATGGPVSPDHPYVVGERGPELFVPTTSGTVVAAGGGSPRDVRVSININAPSGSAPDMLARSSRQVARAVRNALLVED